jgi:hypothetical protein
VSEFDQGLIRRAKVGAIPRDAGEWIMPKVSSWSDLMTRLNEARDLIRNKTHDRRTLVLESLGEFVKLATADCLENEFNNNRHDFKKYGDGVVMTLEKYIDGEFKPLVADIHRSGCHVLMSCHSQQKKINNIQGADYDQFITLLPPAVWKSLEGWVDVVLFFNMVADATEDAKTKKIKALTGSRMIHTSWSPIGEAKNWLDLPDTIDMGSNGKEAAENFWNEIQERLPAPVAKGTTKPKKV